MFKTKANRIFLIQILSTLYGVSRNHINMKQKIDLLGFAVNLHEAAHGMKKPWKKVVRPSIFVMPTAEAAHSGKWHIAGCEPDYPEHITWEVL